MSNADLIRRLRDIYVHRWLASDLAHTSDACREAADALEAHEWSTDMDAAPRDGTVVVIVGRYQDAWAGYPRHAHFMDGAWRDIGRARMEPLVAWAWHPRDESWPDEPGRK